MRKKYNKRYLGIVKQGNIERIGVYQNKNLIGFTGYYSPKKRIKADLDKIEFINQKLWQ